MVVDKIANKKILTLVNKIKTHYKPDKTILFGSYPSEKRKNLS
ncbi:MAG: hypothetical protein AB1485_04940 [Candidatus Thermoplasmatota archaeon]